MKATIIAAAFVAGAAAWKHYGVSTNTTMTTTYATEYVTEYTTYCPKPTQFEHGGKIYTVTEATVITITDCACNHHKPMTTSTTTPAGIAPIPIPKVYATPTPAAIKPGNMPPVVPHATGAKATHSSNYIQPSTSDTPAIELSNDASIARPAGVALAAILGLVAFLL